MKKNWLLSGLLALVLSVSVVPGLAAQEGTYEGEYSGGGDGGGKTRLGLQASTNFEQMLVGLKIQLRNFAIIPKTGFFVQNVKDADTGLMFGMGCAIEYYIPSWRMGKLRPYVGDELLMFINKVDKTRVFVVDDMHIGIEYWLTDDLSLGGNVGVQFGFAKTALVPTTGVHFPNTNFTFSMGGKLHLTYSF